jgi:myo-inositol-1-phosphate synthase|tara:strand:- start:6027 stop:6224 length:198 start_codon:yes stop_codon:yes gene_type:complete
LISSGLHKRSEKYAEISADIGSNFINATPTSIATNESFITTFKDKKLIVVGDDLTSQFGGTAFHK